MRIASFHAEIQAHVNFTLISGDVSLQELKEGWGQENAKLLDFELSDVDMRLPRRVSMESCCAHNDGVSMGSMMTRELIRDCLLLRVVVDSG